MKENVYEKQTKLSFVQFLSELPNFIFILISLILSKSILVFVDMFDSLGYLLRFGMVALLSKKLSKDLRFEYNYGVGKVESISSVLCDGILLFGFVISIGISIFTIFNPTETSDLLITAVVVKFAAVIVDTVFLVKQQKISKTHNNAMAQTNYAAAKAAFISDLVTFISFLAVWLLRNNLIGLYITPILSIIIALYFIVGCIKRIRASLSELTDKTLPEEFQMKILNILTKYCVFDTNNTLLVMRPYQIAATERILNKILVSSNYHQEGSIQAGGFIWHTTGSGKTLTSFKTAILASQMDCIEKVLFVVDRKDLDYQTMKEYDRFQKDAANSNKSVAILKKQLEDDNCKIIITTIQKLGIFVKKNKNHPIFQSHIVMIFDECHRSQFGELHKDIVKSFKKFHLFGFTGTPIFKANAGSNGAAGIRTTDQAFGEKLHTYTIIDAINDHNVLPFRIDYIKTVKMKNGVKDKKVEGIDKESALNSTERISAVVNYIIEHFDHKTKRNTNEKYTFNAITNIKENATAKDRNSVKEVKEARRLSGFNSIFCVQSIEMAIKYYKEFQKQISENPQCRLKVGMIYSFGANEAEDENGYVDDENSDDTNGLDVVSRDYLESAIKDYNQMFHTDYDTSSEKFQNYYKDVSLRMKNRELDILIVVNMFLTGFDATTLNTLWVDKNLKMHGLIQAYSRTNRILNSIKTFGNIVCFRDLSSQTDAAIALFGDKDATGTVLLRSFDDYYNGFTDEKDKYHKGYTELVNELLTKFPIQDFVNNVITLEAKKEFVMLYGAILRMRNILTTFDQFEGDDTLSINDLQDYQSHYIDIHDELRPTDEAQKENINDDIVFEMELIKQVDINIDYILMLVAKYHESNCKDSEIIVDIKKAMGGSPELRSKKQLIEDFIASINTSTDIQKDWQEYIQKKKVEELDKIIKELKLKPEETKQFIENSFRDGTLRTTGTDIDKILPAVSRFGGGNRSEIKKNVIARLEAFFEKFFGV